MADPKYTWSDLAALRPQWKETFDESMRMGFEIGPAQTPMMRQCLREKSKAPLIEYIKSLPKGKRY